MNPGPLVKSFFDRFERAGESLDLDVIASEYADSFMFAGPDGVRVVEKQKLLAALPQRQAFFKAAGHQSTRIISLDETRLDDHYVMVRVQFLMRFERAGGRPIDVRTGSTSILYIEDGAARIVFHLEHEDLSQALQEWGLLPASANSG